MLAFYQSNRALAPVNRGQLAIKTRVIAENRRGKGRRTTRRQHLGHIPECSIQKNKLALIILK
jgi:hypothetical protein